MRSRTLALRLLAPAALVSLIGLLGALEYRWLDDVSRADRERRQASLQQRADDFARDFDRELVRLDVVLQAQSDALSRADGPAFARAFDSWRAEARDPDMVSAIFVARANTSDTAAELLIFQPAARRFVSTSWPTDLDVIRQRVQPALAPAGGGLFFISLDLNLTYPSVPALVVPLRSAARAAQSSVDTLLLRGGAMAIARLDRASLGSTLIPDLAARYFPPTDADPYRFAVLDGSDRAHPVAERGFAPGAVIPADRADLAVPLFSLRTELVSQMTTRDLTAAARAQLSGRGAGGGGRGGAVSSPTRTTSIVGGTVTRLATTTSDTSPRPTHAPDGGTGLRGTVQFVVESQGATAPDAVHFAQRALVASGWQLVLQHSAGSLDAAVATARRRNLWLSFGLLAVVASSVVLIVVSAQRAERLATRQIDFVATVTHELRTPLAVIRSAAQNLSAGVIAEPERARKYGELIDAEGRRLSDMVEQVLEYAGLESGARSIPMQAIDVSAVMREALAACAAVAPDSGVEFAVDIADDLPSVVAHEHAIRRAVQNLVANALKYGASGGWIGLSARSTTMKGRVEIQITVSDHGRGIDPADLPHIFEPFYRGRRPMDAQIHGNGLGLSLVSRIARAHGGRVTVASQPGQGAAFTLTLPVAHRLWALRHVTRRDAMNAAHPVTDSTPAPGASTAS